ncbi:hypothetical protein STEG23_005052 [Scotinomys teguina]
MISLCNSHGYPGTSVVDNAGFKFTETPPAYVSSVLRLKVNRLSPCAASDPAPAPRRNHPVHIPTYLRLRAAPVTSQEPGPLGRHHTTRTKEHPDAITPQGPRSTRTPSHHKDPAQATHWDPGAPDAIGLGGPRCNQTILDQEDPEVPQTSLDQEIPEAPIIL